MDNNSDKIIMNSLLEEREQLEMILTDPDHDFHDTRLERVISWTNDLLLAASENEPGEVNLIPYPEKKEVPKRKNTDLKHQSLGSGPYGSTHLIEPK